MKNQSKAKIRPLGAVKLVHAAATTGIRPTSRPAIVAAIVKTIPVGGPLSQSSIAGTPQFRGVPFSWALALMLVLLFAPSSAYSLVVRIKNVQVPNAYLAEDSGKVVYGSYQEDNTISHWEIMNATGNLTGTKRYWIRNIHTGNYMNVENQLPHVQCYGINPTWASPQWYLTATSNPNFLRINNLWKPDQYMHLENQLGYVQHTNVSATLQSSWWEMEQVYPENVEYLKIRSGFTGFLGSYIADPTGDIAANATSPAGSYTNVLWSHNTDERRAHWDLKPSGNGNFYIVNRFSGRKLKQATRTGANIDLVSESDTSTQAQWKVGSFLSGGVYFTSLENASNPGFFLSQGGSAIADGFITSIQTALNIRQRWILDVLPPGASLPTVRYDENSSPYYTEYGITNDTTGYGTLGAYSAARAFEAEGRACIAMGAIGWVATAPADAVVLRFSIDDAASGGGLQRSIKIYKNPGVAPYHNQEITLDSKYAWLYGFPYSHVQNWPEFNNPTKGAPRRAFDHIRVPLNFSIQPGDIIRLSISDGIAGGVFIDYMETEMRPAPIPAPTGAIVVNPGGNIQSAINSAPAGGTVFLSAGVHQLSNTFSSVYPPKEVTIRGAGMWHTTLHFTNRENGTGIRNNGGGKIVVRDLHIKGEVTYRAWDGKSMAVAGTGFPNGSFLDSVWIQHTEGIIIQKADNLQVRNCRLYDNFADGVLIYGGSTNLVYDNNVVRHADDDGLVIPSSESSTSLSGNSHCRYNTVEFNSRASGIAVHRAKRSRIYSNLVKNCWDQGPLRATSTFEGPAWDSTTENEIFHNHFKDNRGDGEIYFSTKYGMLEGVRVFENIFEGSRPGKGLIHVLENPGGTTKALRNMFVHNNTFSGWVNPAGIPVIAVEGTTITGALSVSNCTVIYTGNLPTLLVNPSPMVVTTSGMQLIKQ